MRMNPWGLSPHRLLGLAGSVGPASCPVRRPGGMQLESTAVAGCSWGLAPTKVFND
jgi:hypothetical protein